MVDEFNHRCHRSRLSKISEALSISTLIAKLVHSEDTVRILGRAVDKIFKDVNGERRTTSYKEELIIKFCLK